MAREVKDLLSVADGGPVGPPDVDAIQRRARGLALVRGGAVAGAAVVVIAAVIGFAGGFEQPRTPLVGEGPEAPSTEPIEPGEVDAPDTGPPVWATETDFPAFGTAGSGSQLASAGKWVFVASGHADDAAVVALEVTAGDVAWRADLDGSAFVQAATEELLIASSQTQVLALDVETGRPVWEHELPVGYGAVSATVGGDTLYLVAGAGGEGDTSPPWVHALNLDDGDVRWSSTLTAGTDPQWAPPTIVDDELLVAATPANPGVDVGNMVHALRLTDGSEVWTTDLGGSQGFTSRATAVTDGLLHVHVAGVGVVTLDISDGSVVHTIDEATLIGAGSIGSLYITAAGESPVVRAINPRTGEPLDQHPAWILEGDWFEVEVHAHSSNLLLPSSRNLLAIDTDSGAGAWRHTHEIPAYDVLVLDELLIVADQDARIVATRLPEGD